MENSLVTYGFNKDRERIEQLGSVISVVWLIYIYLYLILHGLPVTLEISLILVSQKLFERKLVAHFLLDNSSKGFSRNGFDAEHWWEIYLVAFLTRSMLAACFVAIAYGNLTRLSFLSSRT